jgi:hypothetical protein
MRKFLMAAAVLAVVGCGEKKANGPDSNLAGTPTTMSDSTRKADSMKVADSMAKMKTDSSKPATMPTTMSDSAHKADSIKNMKPPVKRKP